VASDQALGDGVLTRIKKFSEGNKLKKKAMMMVAKNLPQSQVSRRAFTTAFFSELNIASLKTGITVEQFNASLVPV
jgi:hypothetical protein